MFSTRASSRQFHFILGAKELATLVESIAISHIFANETPTIKA